MDRFLTLKNMRINVPHNQSIEINSLEIKAGDCIHLQSPSGRGKSFFFQTLLGMTCEAPQVISAVESFYGRDNNINPNQLFCYLPSFLPFFSETVFDELCRVGATIEQINRLLKTNLFDEFFLQRSCRDLSSGQNQLLIFLRGILSDRPILIMDELMNAMDFELKSKSITYLREYVLQDRAIIYSFHGDLGLPNSRVISI